MDLARMYGKRFFALFAGMFLLCALIVFTVKYTGPEEVLERFFSVSEDENRFLFYINFYIPFGFYCFALYGCLFSSGFFIRGFCLLAGLAAAVIAGYVLDELFTVNLCMYSAYMVIIAAAFSPPKNIITCACSTLFFVIFLFHPPFLGPALDNLSFPNHDIPRIAVFAAYLVCLAAMGISVRLLLDKYLTSEAKVFHLDQVGVRMVLFNHRLQDYVKNLGERAVKKDRLRFTRDLHDSCGYVFTNIIAVSDAAISRGAMEIEKTREVFSLIRNLAGDGLKSTREILHMIRDLQDPAPGGIDTIYQMKSIFEEVMGIKVDIESGNMRHDYGPAMNTVLTRIVQEAFTNSVRHGYASRIQIQFWEFPSYLIMTVADNGVGSRNIVKGIGLVGMEERLAAVGGTLEVSSPEDGGFRLKIEIPLIGPGGRLIAGIKNEYSAGGRSGALRRKPAYFSE